MATGTGNLPNQGMDAVPFTPIISQWGDEIIENIESLADGTGIGDEAITSDNIDWTNFIGFRAYQSTNLTATGGTSTNIPFNNEIYDVGGNFDNTTGIFTAPVDGVYIFHFSAYLEAAIQGRAFYSFLGNVPAIRRGYERGLDIGANQHYNRIESTEVVMKAGETFGLRLYVVVSANIANTSGGTFFTGRLAVPLPAGFIT